MVAFLILVAAVTAVLAAPAKRDGAGAADLLAVGGGRSLRVLTVAAGCQHCHLAALEVSRYMYASTVLGAAPPVHIAEDAEGIPAWEGDQVVLAPQGSWLHAALGFNPEAAAPIATHAPSASGRLTHNNASSRALATHTIRSVIAASSASAPPASPP
jgi:hypothetical protein